MSVKKYLKFIVSIILCLCVCISSFVGCAEDEPRPVGVSYGFNGNVDGVEFSLDDLGGAADAHTVKQRNFLRLTDKSGVSDIAVGKEELSRPRPVTFYWTAAGAGAVGYTVRVSESPDMSGSVEYYAAGDSLDVYNLKIATRYYWTVTASVGDKKVQSGVASFTTVGEAPRNVYIDGVTNCRDLGGYMTADGKRLNQGLIYRTGRFNASNESECIAEVTQKGMRQALEELGLKTEIDLRKTAEASDITASVLGDTVNYVACPMEYDSDVLYYNAEEIRHVFSVLGDMDNYPVFFHCHIGTDRTGLIAYLINGLLGVSKDDLFTDYLFSNFGNIGGSRSVRDINERYVKKLDIYDGETLSEKIESYLLSIGVTYEEMFVLRYMMLMQ